MAKEEGSGASWEFRLAIGALLAGIVVALVAFVGARVYTDRIDDGDLADQVYLAAQTFTVSLDTPPEEATYPGELQIARFLAPLTLATGALLALAGLFRETRDRFRIWRTPNTVVVAGLGAVGLEAARSAKRQGYRVVTIEALDLEAVNTVRRLGIPVVTGDARERSTWHQARAKRATDIIVTCGHDQTTGEAAMAAIAEIDRDRWYWPWPTKRPVDIRAHLDDRRLAALHERQRTSRREGAIRPITLRSFHVNDLAAAQLLAMYPPCNLLPSTVPRVVLVGSSNLARAVLIQLARYWSVARHCTFPDTRLAVLVASADAPSFVAETCHEVPDLERVLALSTVTEHLHRPDVAATLLPGDTGRCTQVYVCEEDEAVGLSIALRLTDALSEEAVPERPVVVQTRVTSGPTRLVLEFDTHEETGRIREFATARVRSGARIATFSPLEVACEALTLLGGSVDQRARLTHNMYRAQRIAHPERHRGESDVKMNPWRDLDEKSKGSNQWQVEDMPRQWAMLGVSDDYQRLTGAEVPIPIRWEEADRAARTEHIRWCGEKWADGWEYAPVRDEERKKHPDLLPYDQLPEYTRDKDRIAVLGYCLGLAVEGRCLPARTVRGENGVAGWGRIADGHLPEDRVVSALLEDEVEEVASKALALERGAGPGWDDLDPAGRAPYLAAARAVLPRVEALGYTARLTTARVTPARLVGEEPQSEATSEAVVVPLDRIPEVLAPLGIELVGPATSGG